MYIYVMCKFWFVFDSEFYIFKDLSDEQISAHERLPKL